MKEQLEKLKKELSSAREDSDQHANIFMPTSNELKEAYVILDSRHKYQFNTTITHMLHWFNPSFL